MITKTDKFYLFWQTDSCLSNWTYTPFEYKGRSFNNSETALMWEKALHIGDTETAEKILNSKHPRVAKELGRTAKGYAQHLWEPYRLQVMTDILIAKANTNKKVFNELQKTLGLIIAEASPKDKIWGIGLAPEDARALNQANWNGLNLLGVAWMQARKRIFGE